MPACSRLIARPLTSQRPSGWRSATAMHGPPGSRCAVRRQPSLDGLITDASLAPPGHWGRSMDARGAGRVSSGPPGVSSGSLGAAGCGEGAGLACDDERWAGGIPNVGSRVVAVPVPVSRRVGPRRGWDGRDVRVQDHPPV
jgi:hypothetical protein